MGGITTWKDAAEFLLLGRRQPAGLYRRDALRLPHHRRPLRRAVELDGLERLCTIDQIVAESLHRISDFKDFDLSFRAVARIIPAKCIKCNLCYVACNDTAHQCIDLIDAHGAVVQPHSYERSSNGKSEAIAYSPPAA